MLENIFALMLLIKAGTAFLGSLWGQPTFPYWYLGPRLATRDDCGGVPTPPRARWFYGPGIAMPIYG